jgi:hypothetical protein
VFIGEKHELNLCHFLNQILLILYYEYQKGNVK